MLPVNGPAKSGKEECPERPYIGIDEAGRGCLAGPVVAGAALFAPGFSFAAHLPGLDDSKKLSEAKRQTLAPLVRQHALAWGIGIAWQDEVDEANILNATFRAMGRSVLALYARLAGCGGANGQGFATVEESGPLAVPAQGVEPGKPFSASGLRPEAASPLSPASLPLFIDGNRIIPEPQWRLCAAGRSYGRAPQCPPYAEKAMQMLAEQGLFSSPDFFHGSLPTSPDASRKGVSGPSLPGKAQEQVAAVPVFVPLPEQKAFVQGDSRCPSIAAASILAKTTRDAVMLALTPLFPQYDLAAHKGYGTAAHLAALAAHGPCALHRASFRKVRTEERQLKLF